MIVLSALGGWRMVFYFKKTSSLAFFSKDKNRSKAEYISNRPCVFGLEKWERGTPELIFSNKVISLLVVC
jgi:hypothetical protein